jgi:hypothetical protein
MNRVMTLREQAKTLRVMAASFDIADIRDRLLDLANRCEALAVTIEGTLRNAQQKPIADLVK